MSALSWQSIGFYCLFGTLVFYQQVHIKNFRGGSQAFGFLLILSVVLGVLTGIAYLLYYGWTVAWWAPLVIFMMAVRALPSELLTVEVAPRRRATSRRWSSRSTMIISAGE